MSGFADAAAALVTGADDLDKASTLLALANAGDVASALALARLAGETCDPAGVEAALGRYGAPTSALDATMMIVVQSFAAVRADYASRQDAVAARSALATRAETVYPIAGEAGADVLSLLVSMVGETVRQLSDIAASRAPLVRVETGVSLPSTLIAWDLYADPARADELVGRNRSATPLIMPVVLEASGS